MAEHLFDQVRPYLRRPVEERVAFIRSPRWIGYEKAVAAHRALDELLARPPTLRPPGLLLLGPYANGKTMIAERFAITHFKEVQKLGKRQRVWVVQTREGAGLVHFHAAILHALRAPTSKTRDLVAKGEQIDLLFAQLMPRILIFDEFHNALRGRNRNVEAIFAYLRRLGRERDISRRFWWARSPSTIMSSRPRRCRAGSRSPQCHAGATATNFSLFSTVSRRRCR